MYIKTMPQRFILCARVKEKPFAKAKWMFFRYVYEDIDGTLYTKPDYPFPEEIKHVTFKGTLKEFDAKG